MKMLQCSNPEIFDKLWDYRSLAISRTSNPFSSMCNNQYYELNKYVKGDGSALKLTEDGENFWKWMILSPESNM